MRTGLLLAFALAACLGCAAATPAADAAPPPIDAPFTPPTGTCQPNGRGGLDCVGGPCPYSCCMDGHLATCSVFQGSECGFVRPTECADGTCVVTGACPDAGSLDAGP